MAPIVSSRAGRRNSRYGCVPSAKSLYDEDRGGQAIATLDEGATLQTVQFTIPSLTTVRQLTDIGAALVGVSGVENVDLSCVSHNATVRFDPRFVNTSLVQQMIEGAGYTVTMSSPR